MKLSLFSCSLLNSVFGDILLFSSHLGDKHLCMFLVTQVKINRLSQRQMMEQKLKTVHLGLVGHQGENECVISIFYSTGFIVLYSCCCFVVGLQGRILWR